MQAGSVYPVAPVHVPMVANQRGILVARKMTQRGQFTLPLIGWVAVAAGVAFVGMSIALKVQSSRLEACKADSAAFQAQVKAGFKRLAGTH